MSATNEIVGGSFRLSRRIGGGSFGEVYIGKNIGTNSRVAVKLESIDAQVPQLSYESQLYAIFAGGTGIAKHYWFGIEKARKVMVIDLLGQSLEDLFVSCHCRFSLKTVLMLADQMLSCLEFIHNKSYIHRDVKPENFMMGRGYKAHQVFIIDFGLAKKYRDPQSHVHISNVNGKSFTGTARYGSVNALRGGEQSRRDDLEALGFVWLYFLRGSLPWMGLDASNPKEKQDRICEVKSRTSCEDLCRGFPIEFVDYFHMVKNLRFTETLNYAEARRMFRNLFIRKGFIYDYQYDWAHEGPVTPSRLIGVVHSPQRLEDQHGPWIPRVCTRDPPSKPITPRDEFGIRQPHSPYILSPRISRPTVEPKYEVLPLSLSRRVHFQGSPLPYQNDGPPTRLTTDGKRVQSALASPRYTPIRRMSLEQERPRSDRLNPDRPSDISPRRSTLRATKGHLEQIPPSWMGKRHTAGGRSCLY